jgi:hypothetical protein
MLDPDPHLSEKAVAELKDPDWRDKVNFGVGLSYRPARLYVDLHASQNCGCPPNSALEAYFLTLS